MLDNNACYRALVARDARFDGLFYVGISTTGIYCRSVCTARTANRTNCTFFSNAAAAEANGYRPCLRCRPELAPGLSPYDERLESVAGIVTRIQSGELNGHRSVRHLAQGSRLSERQLRRVVKETTGATPIQIAQTARLLLAKQLLTESRLPIVRIAFASGFSSLRRFNEAFLASYRMSPSRFRREATNGALASMLALKLSFRPPYDWAALRDFLMPRVIAGVEHASIDVYRRTVELNGHCGWLEVSAIPKSNWLEARMSAELLPVLQPILARLRDMFDLHARPDVIASHLQADPRLGPLVRRRPGLRVPGAFDGFELGVRAILGQQVSVRAATTLAGRFAAAFGEPIDTPFPELNRLRPTPERVAAANPVELTALGLTKNRAGSILALARAMTEGELHLHPGADPETTARRLRELPGVGDWTAQYVALRALRWPDAFPASDLGLLKAWGTRASRELREAAEAWRPWRGYAALYLWHSLTNPTKETNHV